MDLHLLNVVWMKDLNPCALKRGRTWEDYGIIRRKADLEREMSTTGKCFNELNTIRITINVSVMPILLFTSTMMF